MRILVTGAGGFIGRRLCTKLAAEHQVFAVIRQPPALPGCTAVVADLTTPIDPALWPERIDAVVHLAQSRRHREFPDGATDMVAVNVLATSALAEYARRAGASVFILASTGSLYASGQEPVTERDPIAPATFYAASKAAAECLLRPYERFMRVCSLRLFFPYGPDQADRLIPSLILRIRAGRPVSLDGPHDGMVLTPTYVDDIVEVFAAALGDSRYSGILNVSTSEVASLRHVAETIGRLMRRDVMFERTGAPEPPRIVPALDRLERLYPRQRFTALATGLEKTMEWWPAEA